MIKKLTAYCFIILANIVLLAHAVIPHHHHYQQVSIERKDCVEKSVAHTHGNSEKDPRRGCETDSNLCVLKQAFIVPSSQNRILHDCENCTDNHHQDLYILANFGDFDKQTFSQVVVLIPKIPPSITPFVTIIPGLRAPPKV